MKQMNKEKFKGYELVDVYPQDGWLKGYFYAMNDDNDVNAVKSGKAYQDLGAVRHRDFILHLLNIRKGERVLDVGCSTGALMVYCALLGAETYGVDISNEAVEKANSYLKKFGLNGKAIACDARKIDFPDNYFDKVISSDFLEHLSFSDSITVLKEIKRVLRPDGLAVIKTPNLTYLKASRSFKMFKRAAAFRNPFSVVIPHTNGSGHQHIGLLNQKGLFKAIRQAGFLNFRFIFDANSRIEKISPGLAGFLADSYFLKSFFSEDLIAIMRKPVITSLFP